MYALAEVFRLNSEDISKMSLSENRDAKLGEYKRPLYC
jgi:hypothetical protein